MLWLIFGDKLSPYKGSNFCSRNGSSITFSSFIFLELYPSSFQLPLIITPILSISFREKSKRVIYDKEYNLTNFSNIVFKYSIFVMVSFYEKRWGILYFTRFKKLRKNKSLLIKKFWKGNIIHMNNAFPRITLTPLNFPPITSSH